jgi:thiol:disulfide interchange protein
MAAPRFLVGLMVVGALGFAASRLAPNAQDISLADWRDGPAAYPSALAEGRSGGRPVAIFFYTDWCGACKALRRNVLAVPEVQRYLEGFVRVKVDLDGGPAAQMLADRFGVRGVPALFVVPPGGGSARAIRAVSAATPDTFLAACRAAVR